MFPKVDLHCHLDGSLSIETIRQLAKRSYIELPEDSNELNQMITAPQDCQSLKQYLECFDLPVSCLQTKENLFDATKSLVLEAAKEHIIYLEIRFAPLLHQRLGLSVKEILKSVINGMNSGIEEVNATGQMMVAGIIVCGMRHMDVQDNVNMLEEAAAFYQHGLCGVDIAGGEDGYPPNVQKAFFDLANQLNIPITIHAGECGSVQNVLDAIQLGAKRIGHGIALYQTQTARDIIKEKNIFLEMCPTSNIQTKAIDSWENYPFQLFKNEGLKLTINTDNRTVSQTTMSHEFEILKCYGQLQENEQKTIVLNSIEAAFTSKSIKKQLRKYVENYYNFR